MTVRWMQLAALASVAMLLATHVPVAHGAKSMTEILSGKQGAGFATTDGAACAIRRNLEAMAPTPKPGTAKPGAAKPGVKKPPGVATRDLDCGPKPGAAPKTAKPKPSSPVKTPKVAKTTLKPKPKPGKPAKTTKAKPATRTKAPKPAARTPKTKPAKPTKPAKTTKPAKPAKPVKPSPKGPGKVKAAG